MKARKLPVVGSNPVGSGEPPSSDIDDLAQSRDSATFEAALARR